MAIKKGPKAQAIADIDEEYKKCLFRLGIGQKPMVEPCTNPQHVRKAQLYVGSADFIKENAGKYYVSCFPKPGSELAHEVAQRRKNGQRVSGMYHFQYLDRPANVTTEHLMNDPELRRVLERREQLKRPGRLTTIMRSNIAPEQSNSHRSQSPPRKRAKTSIPVRSDPTDPTFHTGANSTSSSYLPTPLPSSSPSSETVTTLSQSSVTICSSPQPSSSHIHGETISNNRKVTVFCWTENNMDWPPLIQLQLRSRRSLVLTDYQNRARLTQIGFDFDDVELLNVYLGGEMSWCIADSRIPIDSSQTLHIWKDGVVPKDDVIVAAACRP